MMDNPQDHKITDIVKSGELFTETYSVDEDVVTEPVIHISQEAFPLCEADFLRLKQSSSKTEQFSLTIFIASIGMVIIPIAKLLQNRIYGVIVSVQAWEWIAPCIGLIIALILYYIGKKLPNERKQVMNDIGTHFSTAPRTKHIGERRK